MQALIDFLAQYEPSYRDLVRGHAPQDIDRIEAALGRPLPPFYRDFLATAAANLGFLHDEYDFDAEELVDLIELKRRMLDELGGQVIPVAVDDTTTHSDYYIHLGRPAPHSPGDGELVRSAAGGRDFDDEPTDYEGFRDLLYCRGFRAVRMLSLRERTFLTWRSLDIGEGREFLGLLERILGALGLRSLGLTGPRHPMFERGECAAVAGLSLYPSFVWIYLAARERRELGRVTQTLLDQMPVEGKQSAVTPT